MSRWTNKRWIGRAGRKVGEAPRFCFALYLMVQIVWTPIHLYLEPHSDLADTRSSGAEAQFRVLRGDDAHDDHSDHERHPAAQHDLKVLRTPQAQVAQVVMIRAEEWVAVEKECPLGRVSDFSGLSPPEIPRCWQFLFRAALPVRAPSLLS
jgi:hypothetical protein